MDDVTNTPNLTEAERKVLEHLVEAWNAFAALPGGHQDDKSEMKTAIHAAQLIIAGRVAARVDPGVWSYNTRGETETTQHPSSSCL